MAERVWLSQEIDGEDRYIHVPATAVPTHVQAGWLPAEAPPRQEKPRLAPLPAAPKPSPSPAPRKGKPSASPSPAAAGDASSPEEN